MNRFFRNLYQKFIEKKLPVGDQLAAARSILANERTYLSYHRTAITLIIAGLTFIRFFDIKWIELIGWSFLFASLFTEIVGTIRFVKMRNLIISIEQNYFKGNKDKPKDD